MEQNKSIAVFENKQIRKHYNTKTETWYFSVVDIVEVLSDSVNPTDYLKKLRKRDSELAIYLGTNCPQVEMETQSDKKKIDIEVIFYKLYDLTYEEEKVIDKDFWMYES